MNDYMVLIVSTIVCCSLAAVLFIYLHYRRRERNSNRYIVTHLREQDRLRSELERTCIEKEVIEKVLMTYFSKAAESSGAEDGSAPSSADCKKT